MAVQVVADFEQSVARFEKKVHDLKLSRTIAIQNAPQIRLIQNNDKALIDRVQTAEQELAAIEGRLRDTLLAHSTRQAGDPAGKR